MIIQGGSRASVASSGAESTGSSALDEKQQIREWRESIIDEVRQDIGGDGDRSGESHAGFLTPRQMAAATKLREQRENRLRKRGWSKFEILFSRF